MSKKRNVLIGGAWPYANSTLHVGHLAGLLGGDVLARYHRLKGDNVVYVSGSDCHGTPITQRAKKENTTPREIADKYHQNFLDLFSRMSFSYDLYAKTMDKEHKEEVKKLLETLYRNGYIYEKVEDQVYCETCKEFLNDREILYTCPVCGKEAKGDGCDCGHLPTTLDLVKGRCSTCNSKLTLKKDKNLYFKLSAFQKPIEAYVKKNEKRWRLNAVNETKKYLSMGLIDRAITRNLSWGIDVPFPGYEDKKIYVWIEAVMGYISACKRYCKEHNLDWKDYLLEDRCDLSYMVHGKDNITFHTIIFPSILLGLEKGYKLPTDIVSSEFMTMNGDKISKSTGNYQETDEIIDLGHSDTLRYYIIAFGPEKKDSDFTINDYVTIHNNEISNKLGNFINRTLKFKGIEEIKKKEIYPFIKEEINNTYKVVGKCIEKYDFKEAAKHAITLVEYANRFYDENKPWELFKNDKDKFDEVIYNCLCLIMNIANIFEPFLPITSAKIAKMTKMKKMSWKLQVPTKDLKLENIEQLFSKIVLKNT